jgi:hypothetical protein
MADYEPTVRDLALYFRDDTNQVRSCWVSEAVYTQTAIPMDPIWQNADLYEPPTEDGEVCYVVNLSRLLGPGKGPVPGPGPGPGPSPARTKPKVKAQAKVKPQARVRAKAKGKAATQAASAGAGAKDLVVIPSDAPGAAYVVPRAVYTDPLQCPSIGLHPDSADLDFMALNEGVVLANLPKASSPSGWTCYLLSLLSLKSGAVQGLNLEDKASYFQELEQSLQPLLDR